jgi:hypothetical protein
VALFASGLLAVPQVALASTLPHAMVQSVHAAPNALPPNGGQVQVTATVQHAGSCQLQLLSSHPFSVVYPRDPTTACREGRYSAHVVIGAKNESSSFTAGFYVVVEALSRPAVLSVNASPSVLPPGGGEVRVTGRVKHAGSCQLELLQAGLSG